MNHTHNHIFISAGLLIAMFAATFLGRKWRRYSVPKDTTGPHSDNFVTNSIFALMGLLLAFSFSSAYGRLDLRRQLIIMETNEIATAYLRIDLLPPAVQPQMRQLFKEYVTHRLRYYKEADIETNIRELAREQEKAQLAIWKLAASSLESPSAQSSRMLVLNALNDMIDITTTRTATLYNHIPGVIVWMLVILPVVCAFFIGEHLERGAFRYGAIFALVICLVFYVIMDIDYPRVGLVRTDNTQQLLVDLAEQLQKQQPG